MNEKLKNQGKFCKDLKAKFLQAIFTDETYFQNFLLKIFLINITNEINFLEKEKKNVLY